MNELAELVTNREIAQRLRVSRDRVRRLAHQPGFPTPVGRIADSTVWRWSDIDAWAHHNERYSNIERWLIEHGWLIDAGGSWSHRELAAGQALVHWGDAVKHQHAWNDAAGVPD